MKLLRTFMTIFVTAVLGVGLMSAPAQAAPSLDPLDANPELKSAIEHHYANLNPAIPQPDKGTEGTDAWGDSYNVSVRSIQYGTETTEWITSCVNPRGTCTLSRAVTLTASTSGGFGLSAGAVSAEASLGYSTSYTDTVACTSPVLGYNQTYVARPLGTFVIYDVHRYNIFGAHTGTARGTAFFPTGISCRVMYI